MTNNDSVRSDVYETYESVRYAEYGKRNQSRMYDEYKNENAMIERNVTTVWPIAYGTFFK